MSPIVMAGIVLLVIFLTQLLKSVEFMSVPLWYCLTPIAMVFVGFMGYELLLVKSDVTLVAIVNALLNGVVLGGAAAGVYKTVQVIREHFGLNWQDNDE